QCSNHRGWRAGAAPATRARVSRTQCQVPNHGGPATELHNSHHGRAHRWRGAMGSLKAGPRRPVTTDRRSLLRPHRARTGSRLICGLAHAFAPEPSTENRVLIARYSRLITGVKSVLGQFGTSSS